MTIKKDLLPKDMTDQELLGSHFEIHRAWMTAARNGTFVLMVDGFEVSWTRQEIGNYHKLIIAEMEARGWGHKSQLDEELAPIRQFAEDVSSVIFETIKIAQAYSIDPIDLHIETINTGMSHHTPEDREKKKKQERSYQAGNYILAETNSHTHTVTLDENGNGTSSTNNEHNHTIESSKVQISHEHIHELSKLNSNKLSFNLSIIERYESATPSCFVYSLGVRSIVPEDYVEVDRKSIGNHNYIHIGDIASSDKQFNLGDTLKISTKCLFTHEHSMRVLSPKLIGQTDEPVMSDIDAKMMFITKGFSVPSTEPVPNKYVWWNLDDQQKRIDMMHAYYSDKTKMAKIMHLFDDHSGIAVCWADKIIAFETEMPLDGVDEISKVDITQLKVLPNVKIESFSLKHHYWRGPKTKKHASVEHWDLFIGEKMVICSNNPIKTGTDVAFRKPYSKRWHSMGVKGPEYVEPGTPGNPTKDTPSHVRQIDHGQVIVFEDGKMTKRYAFKGMKLKGNCVLSRKNAKKNLWNLDAPTKTDGEVTEQPVIFGDDNVAIAKEYNNNAGFFVSGIVFAPGVWKGEYYSPAVLKEEMQQLIGAPVSYISHKNPETIGKMVDIWQMDNGDLFGVARIDDVEAQERFERNEMVGFSPEMRVFVDRSRGIVTKVKSWDRVVAVTNPACRVCLLDAVLTNYDPERDNSCDTACNV